VPDGRAKPKKPAPKRIHLQPGPEGRIPSIRVRGLARAPFDDVYHFILSRSWPQFLASAVATFLALNTIFAVVYWQLPGAIEGARPGSFQDAFFFSVHTLATIGYGSMFPKSVVGQIVVASEAFLGLLCIAILTGLTFAKFARPQARVAFTARAVIAPRDGVPHLQFRMVNFRHNQVVEAQLRVFVLVEQKTAEGQVMRVPVDLSLVRDRTPMFALTWTAMHRIDAESPFHGADWRERLGAQKAEIFLALTGLDDTLGQTIHARYRYRLEDVVENALFADVLTIDEKDGARVVDYEHFHEIVPLG
jgi:inward rectifier potassium channel